MASRRLTDLDKPVYLMAERAMIAWERAGLTILVTCTYRSCEEQGALYAQGRVPLEAVNAARLAVGLPAINKAQNKRKVTFAPPGLKAMHTRRKAFDVVPLESGKCVWDEKAPVWQEVGAIGESVGLEWSGRWKRFREYPHFQYTTPY